VTCGLKDAVADRICQILKATYDSCRFPHVIADYSRLRSTATALAKAGVDPEVIDPQELDCGSRDAFFESLERMKRRLVPTLNIDVSAVIEELQRAVETWRSGTRTTDVIHAIEEAIKTLAELGEKKEAWRWYENVRKEYKIPISVKIKKPTERRASRRRAVKEAKAALQLAKQAVEEGAEPEAEELAKKAKEVAMELAKEDAVVVELARKVLEHWLTELRRQLPAVPGLRWEMSTDRVAVRVSLVLSPGDVETENKVLEKLSLLYSMYGLERRESTTRNRRFVHYLADLERHENFRKLVETMRVLYRTVLDEMRRAMPTADYSSVVAKALNAMNNWVTMRDVYLAMATSPNVETLSRLLAAYPLMKKREEEAPGVAVGEPIPVKITGPRLEEVYRKTYIQTVRELAIRDALRTHETGAIVTREPWGRAICWGVLDDRVCFYNTPEECVELCLARLIDRLASGGRIDREQYRKIMADIDAGRYDEACRAVRNNIDYFAQLYKIIHVPTYCR